MVFKLYLPNYHLFSSIINISEAPLFALVLLTMANSTHDAIFIVLKWTTFFILCLISILVIRDIFSKYNSKLSGFNYYEVPITEQPTITICFDGNNNKHYDDFKIYFEKKPPFNKGEHQFSSHYFEGNDSKVANIEELTPISFGKPRKCYKISLKIEIRGIHLKFDQSISNKDLPSLQIYISSEKNAYGILLSEWMDGRVIKMDFSRHQYKLISLKPEKHIYLRENWKCNDQSFYHCFGSKILKTNFSECPNKCLTFTLPFSTGYNITNNPKCKDDMHNNCTLAINQFFENITMSGMCPQSCSTLQYLGEIQKEVSFPDKYLIWFRYKFDQPQSTNVFEEYLIYDTIGMITSVGATLVLFLGFSFNNCIMFLLDHLSRLTENRVRPQSSISHNMEEIEVEQESN